MLDSLDLEALRKERLTFLQSNTQKRAAIIAEYCDRLVEKLKDHFPELDIKTPVSITLAPEQRRNYWFKLIVLWVVIFLSDLLSLPSSVSILFLIIALVWVFGGSIKYFFGPQGSPVEKRHQRMGCLWFVGFVILIAILTPLLESFISSVFGLSGSIASFISVVISVVMCFLFLFGYVRVFYILTLRGPLAQGNYDHALQRVESLSWMLPKYPLVSSAHTAILMLAGRYEEAHHYAKDVFEKSPSHSLTTKLLALGGMIEALLGQQHYEEALSLLEIYVEYSVGTYTPNYPFMLLVQYYNQQETYPERALQLSQFMMEFYRKPQIRLIQSMGWEMSSAVHAVALARNNYIDEARHLIAEIIPRTKNVKPYAAQIHYRGGLVELAAENKEAARAYFQQAIALDPNGAAGQKAQAALAEL